MVTAAEELALHHRKRERGAPERAARPRREEALRGARARARGASDEIEDQVRRHPFAALGIAAAVGLVIGVMLTRK